MLVLARKEKEKIVITVGGRRIEIYVVEIRDRNKVKLGFEADKDITINRGEYQELVDAKGGEHGT